jgi:hypothetical protein
MLSLAAATCAAEERRRADASFEPVFARATLDWEMFSLYGSGRTCLGEPGSVVAEAATRQATYAADFLRRWDRLAKAR